MGSDMMYDRKKEFIAMIDAVAVDIARELNGESIPVSYSGGIDSTVTLISFIKQTDNILVCHYPYKRNKDDPGDSKYARLLNAIADYFCDVYHLTKQFVPWSANPYGGFVEAGIKKYVVSDGFDLGYGQIYEEFGSEEQPFGKTLKVSYGERFRSEHPWLDTVMHIPGRFKGVRASRGESGADRLMSGYYTDMKYRPREKYGAASDVIDFDGHPLFIDFFSEHHAGYLDVVYRKYYNEIYVKDFLGVSYVKLIRKISHENNLRFSFIDYLLRSD